MALLDEDKARIISALTEIDGDGEDFTPLWEALELILEDEYDDGYASGFAASENGHRNDG